MGRRKSSHDIKQSRLDAYNIFERRIQKLNRELRKLCNKARQLGSPEGILAASTRLHERLERVLLLFRDNAGTLYPNEIRTHTIMYSEPLNPGVHRRKVHDRLNPSNEKSNLVQEFRLFSKDVMALFYCFSQFPQFGEELIDWSPAEYIQVWANSLDNFEHEFATLAVQTYLYDSMTDIGVHMEALATRLVPTFTELGIPAIQASQDREISKLQNQTIVATLFAGIATGMLQIYSNPSTGEVYTAIVMLWYISLVFSIASAVNGLLGISWAQSVYRSPDRYVPWWILIWIRSFPLVFLVISDACSFVALILIVLTPQQSRVAPMVMITLIAFIFVGLLAVLGWFICEVLVTIKYGGRVWLLDVIRNWWRRVLVFMKRSWLAVQAGGRKIIYYRPMAARFDIQEEVDLFTLPLDMDRDNVEHSGTRIIHRWHDAVRRVIEERRKKSGRSANRLPVHFAHLDTAAANFPMDIEGLRNMTISVSHSINEAHNGALVRSLQFSPDGRYLVASSWDSRTFLFRINYQSPVPYGQELIYSTNMGCVHQVEWSPDGNKLLMRSNKKLVVWELDFGEADGRQVREADIIVEYSPEEIRSDRTIRSASWRGDGNAFFVVQGNRILTIDARGMTLRSYPAQHLELRDVCVTKDSCWMICVGKYLPQEQQQSTQKFGIFVWDLKNHKVAKQVPVYYGTSNITLASDDKSVLVSYKNRSPSQFWQLEIDAGGTDFILRHSYYPKESVVFAALASIFGGDRDRLVLRAATAGDIYVWDRDSATFLHCIKPPPMLEGRFTSFAWNRGSSDYMFATGTHDGRIHIWVPKTDKQSLVTEGAGTCGSEVYTVDLVSESTGREHGRPHAILVPTPKGVVHGRLTSFQPEYILAAQAQIDCWSSTLKKLDLIYSRPIDQRKTPGRSAEKPLATSVFDLNLARCHNLTVLSMSLPAFDQHDDSDGPELHDFLASLPTSVAEVTIALRDVASTVIDGVQCARALKRCQNLSTLVLAVDDILCSAGLMLHSCMRANFPADVMVALTTLSEGLNDH